MELTIAHYFPQLASFWGSTEGDLRRFFADLHADSNFVPAINDKIRDVPDFDGKQFKLASEMRVYRCLLYLAARVIRPEHFVETGVQNGMSSAFILLALKHNGRGQLYSVDLPPIEQRILDQGTNPLPKNKAPGWIIPDDLRSRHELLLGPAEQLLPKLLADLGSIDIFLHDSDHSYSHIMFEAGLAWRYLRAGGHIMIDNVEQNAAFTDFARGVAAPSILISTFEGADRVWQHGLIGKLHL